jgi:flavin reductase (DIM6/NTAB) family NADH-FMN oxidoreductase RutF
MHQQSEPAILYFGTPVVLISTVNENGSYNLAPMSSAFWLGWRCILGLSNLSKTTENLRRNRQCVLNLPSVNQVQAVNALALTTGSNPVPETKQKRGYRFEQDKFEMAGLTPLPAATVQAPRVLECPVHLEAEVAEIHDVARDNPLQSGRIVTIELKILRVHLEESIAMEGHPNRVDPDKWRPLIMSFQEFYGLGDKIHYSRLGEIPEQMYTTSDLENARRSAVCSQ